MMNRHIKVALLLIAIFAGACDSSPNAEEAVPTFVIEGAGGERFIIQIHDPMVVRQADSLLANDINKIVHGPLRAGNGGFNLSYGWHLDPDSISFPDLAIELCDGRPSFIDADLDYWLNTVGIYCPWGAKIVERK